MLLYIKTTEVRFHGLTTLELRRLVYQAAERNRIAHNFMIELWVPTMWLLENFMSFWRKFKTQTYNYILTHRMFNLDETGVSIVPKSYFKILVSTGKPQVGTLISGERGKLMTTTVCFSAVGNYMQPIFIFPRKRMNP